jgi:hypothetical protein
MVRLEGNMLLKNPVTPPGIDPGTVRLINEMYILYMYLVVRCSYKTMPFYDALHDLHNMKHGSSTELTNFGGIVYAHYVILCHPTFVETRI